MEQLQPVGDIGQQAHKVEHHGDADPGTEVVAPAESGYCVADHADLQLAQITAHMEQEKY